jgi:hypothetical protein
MLRVPCNPKVVNLAEVADSGGVVVVDSWQPPDTHPGPFLGQPVDLSDGRILVLATVLQRSRGSGPWSFRVRPMRR